MNDLALDELAKIGNRSHCEVDASWTMALHDDPESIHPSLLKRKVVHIDMDAFYASVEERDDPSLCGKPVIVGGSREKRGVVATANYAARAFGIRSAMSSARAHRLCPHAVFLRPDFTKYLAVSRQIRTIFQRHSQHIEPLSLDEAYLDVTEQPAGRFAVQVARQIKVEIARELGLTCSAGVAPNKLLAKIASELDKPDGLTLVLPAQVQGFMRDLPLRRIPGVGPATEKRLASLGYRLCSDLWQKSAATMAEDLGERMGHWLYARSFGIDERPVEGHRERKSVGRETTFNEDILALAEIHRQLPVLAAAVVDMLHKRGLVGRTITVKVKYANFQQITRSVSLGEPTACLATIVECARRLLLKSEVGRRSVRLLGVSLSGLTSQSQFAGEIPALRLSSFFE